MSRFFVGQRVRVKWSLNWPELAGQEGRIVAKSLDIGREGISEWQVAPDTWGSHIFPAWNPSSPKPRRFAPNSKQLEPILPEGAAPSEFTTLVDLLSSLNVRVSA